MKAADVLLLTKFSKGERLPSKDIAQVWLAASQFVQNVARRHYQSVQRRGFKYKLGGMQSVISNPLKCIVTDARAYDKTMTRLLLFFEFARESVADGKGIPWVLFVYRCRFALAELVLDCKINGIGIIPDVPISKLITDLSVKRITDCQATLRKYDIDATDLTSLRRIYESTTTKRKTTIDSYLSTYSAYIQARFPHLYPASHGYEIEHFE